MSHVNITASDTREPPFADVCCEINVTAEGASNHHHHQQQQQQNQASSIRLISRLIETRVARKLNESSFVAPESSAAAVTANQFPLFMSGRQLMEMSSYHEHLHQNRFTARNAINSTKTTTAAAEYPSSASKSSSSDLLLCDARKSRKSGVQLVLDKKTSNIHIRNNNYFRK